jgi:RNA polymerase sigma factor (sigma-70 family)
LSDKKKSNAEPRITRREQSEGLGKKEAELGRLASQENKEEFFNQITPLLKPLRSYIKRRLRLAYLTLQIRTPVYTSGDLLDQVILRAYERYGNKPANLTLEEWVYHLANRAVDNYISRRKAEDARRSSLENLNRAELRTLDEIPFTADADGEVWFPEELDDSEIPSRDFPAPPSHLDPEKELEMEEEVSQILEALSRIPERERTVFELYVVEGFPKESVARIYGIPPEQVQAIADKVRAQVQQRIGAGATERKKAS